MSTDRPDDSARRTAHFDMDPVIGQTIWNLNALRLILQQRLDGHSLDEDDLCSLAHLANEALDSAREVRELWKAA